MTAKSQPPKLNIDSILVDLILGEGYSKDGGNLEIMSTTKGHLRAKSQLKELILDIIGEDAAHIATDDLIIDLDVSFKIQERLKAHQRAKLERLFK